MTTEAAPPATAAAAAAAQSTDRDPTGAQPGAGPTAVEIGRAVCDLFTDGITAHRSAFATEFADRIHEDIERAFEKARNHPGGAVGRGPNRYYVEIHPEQLRDFVELVDHPWVRSVCEAVLGADYRIVELGFDVPLEGAVNQPWHRDFPSPAPTREEHRLTSLAFNVTAVDTAEDMGPFEIALGTQWESGSDFAHEMFPDKADHPRYAARAVRKYPRRGDISARSALTVHRGTANRSAASRPVLVLGVDAPGAGNDAHHAMAVTSTYWTALPERVRDHLQARIVDELQPIVQQHTIEGLVMGDA